MTVRGSPSFYALKDVRASLARADLGGALNTQELLDIARVLQCARLVRGYVAADSVGKTCIDHLFQSLHSNKFLEEKISASITGGMVALQDAVARLLADGTLAENPIIHRVAAVSVGVCDGKPTLDLDYAHDSTAEVDLNVVMTDDGRYVELQGTAEHEPFGSDALESLLALARKGLKKIFTLQKNAVNS